MGVTTIPCFSDLSDVYGASGAPDARARYAALATKFHAQFDAYPDVCARAPGRVNLIGEHIDYEGYGVLPMAIRADVVVAARVVKGSSLFVENLDQAGFPGAELSVDPEQVVDTSHHRWTNYFIAAYKGVHEYLAAKGCQVDTPGLQVMVAGQVPPGSGLSSSSAFVVASSIAILAAYGLEAPKEDVAAFTCTCERHAGVSSGGMDQAISVMGIAGQAAYVQFDPVRASPVPLPSGASFVIANSLTVSNKAETSAGRYNLRVVECRLAAIILAKALGVAHSAACAIKTLQELEPIVSSLGLDDRVVDPSTPARVALLDRCAACAAVHLEEGAYTPKQIEDITSCKISDKFGDLPGLGPSFAWAEANGGYKLRTRAVHVFSEAARVLRFQNICESDKGDSEKLKALGALMESSHRSCADNFECSCPELEQLTTVAVQNGSQGSRLTGAGWGGCSVHLVHRSQVDTFIKALKKKYYANHSESIGATEDELNTFVFASQPSSGAVILCFDDWSTMTAEEPALLSK